MQLGESSQALGGRSWENTTMLVANNVVSPAPHTYDRTRLQPKQLAGDRSSA